MNAAFKKTLIITGAVIGTVFVAATAAFIVLKAGSRAAGSFFDDSSALRQEISGDDVSYAVIKSYSPSAEQTCPSGSALAVSVSARRGSEVTASFNGKSQSLNAENNGDGGNSDFICYNGVFALPGDNARDINLGKIVFEAVYNGKSESFSSGDITCKKSDAVIDYDPAVTPTGGKYINVGSGYIAEITGDTAETFDGNVSADTLKNGSADWSRPTNNYLPRGTVDYCSPDYVISESKGNKNEYVTLRAGYRVYKQKKDKPYSDFKQVTKQYIGKLPDRNEINGAALENKGTHTVLTVNTNWKAPFYFDILPQSYATPQHKITVFPRLRFGILI